IAPFEGVVTKQDAKVGQIVSINTPLISLMSRAQFQIEANIAEADIAKIKIGNAARVTLDTYGSQEIFFTRVAKIDPAETLIEGVATYKTTFQFDREDSRIKSGMTANIDIVAQEQKGVLSLPMRAILQESGRRFVLARNEEEFQKKEVMLGIRGVSGDVEILAGVKEGDEVMLSPDKFLKAQENK
ncbi:MAG: efflux RND transporter periplasmic adaptor subunit, partial [Candidatus Portnoybacteria bacterium]|nr:efflux RND transporter periplasmic adaptor subunit [Candidatus Portnoybacteria bacterium]